MNFALSQRRPDRHPVGLLVVVGLHVLLAGVLLTARLATRPPADTPFVPLAPLDPVKPVPQKSAVLPKPTDPVIHPPIVTPPVIPVDPPPDAIHGVVDDHPPPPDVKVVEIDHGGEGSVRETVRLAPRAARINAAASECRPEYPPAAQRAGATGTTRIRFSVDATGRISGSQILQSSGSTRENRMMDKAAAEALAQCPVQVGTDELGRPTGTTTDVIYTWSLN